MSKSNVKEPLVRIVKRDPLPFWKSWGIRVAAFALSMIVYFWAVYFFTGKVPGDVLKALMKGTIGLNNGRISDITLWKNIRDIMFLFGVALALAPAFKMRFWNIGGEGQIIMGGIATAIIMRTLAPHMGSNTVSLILMAVISAVAGALWAAIPAIFNATHKTNETLFTLMMNYIAMQLAAFVNVLWENPKGSGTMGTINGANEEGYLPQSFLSKLVGEDGYLLIVLMVLAIAVFIYFYLTKSQHGYEIAVIGDSQDTARYAGINVKKVIIRTVAISGAICGFMGFLVVSGADHTVSTTTGGGRGFTAIIVTWLGKMNVFYMLLVAALIVGLGNGAAELANTAGLDKALGDVLTGIVLFFILASELFVTYKLIFRHAKKEEM